MAIQQHVLETFPEYHSPYTVNLSAAYGSFLSPPGYPIYDAKTLDETWTKNRDAVILYYDDIHQCYREIARNLYGDSLKAIYNNLWNRPNETDETIQQWERAVYAHMRHSYHNDAASINDRYRTICWPVDTFWLIDTRKYHDNPAYKDEIRAIGFAINLVLAAKRIAEWKKIAIPDNHYAVRYIRCYYPNHQPRFDLF